MAATGSVDQPARVMRCRPRGAVAETVAGPCARVRLRAVGEATVADDTEELTEAELDTFKPRVVVTPLRVCA